jgi:hypothetical protein
MTFAERILERADFQTSIMGLPMHFSFDKRLCEFAEASGISKEDGDIALNPELKDSLLLDTAAHEVIEVAKARMEWDMPHPLIQQLGVFMGQVLEWED